MRPEHRGVPNAQRGESDAGARYSSPPNDRRLASKEQA
jgi:hypothetical protein